MAVSIDKIDILMERAQIGYKEARDVLEKFDGNVVEALIYLENEDKTTTYKSEKQSHHHQKSTNRHSFFDKVKSFIAKVHKTKFQILKKDRTIIDLPMTLAIILILIGMPFTLFLLALGILTGHRLAILKPNGKNIRASEALQFVEKQQEKFNKGDNSQ